MKRAVWVVIAVVALLAGAKAWHRFWWSLEAAVSGPARIATLETLDPLRAAFDQHAAETRLLVLVSPT